MFSRSWMLSRPTDELCRYVIYQKDIKQFLKKNCSNPEDMKMLGDIILNILVAETLIEKRLSTYSYPEEYEFP